MGTARSYARRATEQEKRVATTPPLCRTSFVLPLFGEVLHEANKVNRFKPNQTVRINDTQSEYHKSLAKVVAVGTKSYDVQVGRLTMRVVPEQLLGVRR